MYPLLFILAIAAAHAVVASYIPSVMRTNQTESVRDYLDKLSFVSNDTLFNQMMGSTIGIDPGVVVISIPNASEPANFVWWLRDGCRLYFTLLNKLTVSPFNEDVEFLRTQVDNIIHALIRSQQVVSIEGNVFTGGLDEPVFDVHIGPLTDPNVRFGSPAADGAPFRAIVMIKYAEWLIQPEQNNGTWVADYLWPAINLDLQWVAIHWNQSSYDLWWPPVWGRSYWTASVEYRALRTGARLGRNIGHGDSASDYESRASVILDYVQESHDTFWNEEEEFMSETTVTNVITGGRSGKGPAPLTVALLNFDPTLGCDSTTFQPCSDRALSYLKVVADAFTKKFPFAQSLPPDQPPAFFAFFLEETSLGGHAQYFATLGVAELIYDSLMTWDLIGELQVTDLSLKFFRQFDPNVKVKTYFKGSHVYARLTDALRNWAEQTILFVAAHTPDDYVLRMAMDKDTAEPTGSRGIIHCLVASLSLHNAYNGLIPPSWADNGLRRESRDRTNFESGSQNQYHARITSP